MSKKVALITGITGQDGSYLTELLLNKNYIVHGIVRRSSLFNRARIERMYDLSEAKNLHLHYGDLIDASNISRLMDATQPDEIYNLAAQSHVGISFEIPEYTSDVDGIGTLRILDAMRNLKKECRFYQASTSELYGKVQKIPQDEETPFYPRSPYAVSKLYSYWIVKNYREAYKMFACNGILFNHESPRRGENFVTRKITLSIARILKNQQDHIDLGNLDAKRDWGYAPEYVEAMWRILQYDRPEDFVIATGETRTVKEFVEKAFEYVDTPIEWSGSGVSEVGRHRKTGKILVKVNPRYYRPSEVDILLGDATKAKKLLGWTPKTTFNELVKIMMDAELNGKAI